jgi:hypothetical protein
MMHYKIILTGSDIFVENYGSADPITGFVACRIIKAETERLAIAMAKRNILVNWNQSFNADRKVGLPNLEVEKVTQVNGWLTREPKNDYFFYTDDQTREAHLEKLINPRRWFKRKPK